APPARAARRPARAPRRARRRGGARAARHAPDAAPGRRAAPVVRPARGRRRHRDRAARRGRRRHRQPRAALVRRGAAGPASAAVVRGRRSGAAGGGHPAAGGGGARARRITSRPDADRGGLPPGPGAPGPGMYADLGLERDIPVLFLGAMTVPRRRWIAWLLRRAGVELTAVGDWHDPRYWGEERTRLLNRAVISLNINRFPGNFADTRF